MKGKKGQLLVSLMVVAILLIAATVVGSMTNWFGFGGTSATIGADGKKVVDSDGTVLQNCPTDGDTSLKIDVKNVANESGEAIDVTGYLYKIVDGSEEYVVAISDTTAPTASTVDCGYKYAFKTVSASGAAGDTSVVLKKLSGDDDVEITNGILYFTADSSAENIIVSMESHASLNCRLYDNNQRAFVWDTSDVSGTDYETDGVNFTTTASNTSAMDETLGINVQYQCKAVETDTNYQDRGVLVLIEAPSTLWATPTVRANGVNLQEVKSSLNSNEVLAYADYEYVFLIPQSVNIYDAGDGVNIDVFMDLAAGVSAATADLEVDFAPRGSVLSKDLVNVIVGTTVKDDSSRTVVHTLFDSIIHIV